MSVSQAEKARKFRALHEAPGSFIIANPWDAGSARLLAGLGFDALATSSGAKAGVLGVAPPMFGGREHGHGSRLQSRSFQRRRGYNAQSA